jgi:hypothetical protein
LLTSLWYLRHGDPGPAGPIIDRLISDAPDRVHPRMLRCEWLSRCGAPLAEQSRALRDVLHINPSDTETTHWLAAVERAQAAAAPALPLPTSPALSPSLGFAATPA